MNGKINQSLMGTILSMFTHPITVTLKLVVLFCCIDFVFDDTHKTNFVINNENIYSSFTDGHLRGCTPFILCLIQ